MSERTGVLPDGKRSNFLVLLVDECVIRRLTNPTPSKNFALRRRYRLRCVNRLPFNGGRSILGR
jgi:hypothetical protein